MKHLLASFLVAIVHFVASGQTVQWASQVIAFSSELTPIQYSAQQILGRPDVLPSGGENASAWTPKRANKTEFVKVGFTNPLHIKQIAIAESHKPTALLNVFIYDEQDQEHLINTFNPRAVPLKGRMMNIFMEKTAFKVKAVKMVFEGAAVEDYYSIDAIAISDSDIPIVAEINIPDTLNKEIYIERLSKNINSIYKEYKPLFSPDGKTLYFSRKHHPQNIGGEHDAEDIWRAAWDSVKGEWAPAEKMDILNNKEPNFISSITPDGKTVLLLLGNYYLEDGSMVSGVSVTHNKNGVWSKPKGVDIKNYYNLSDKANFFLTNDRRVMLISAERTDTQGGRDLYASLLQPDSTWSEPFSLGRYVNSAGEESSPFLAADNKTLYFSSDGFSGFGGADVFVSTRTDDSWTKWSEPQNLGSDINSESEDLFFNIPANSGYAYYSRGVGNDDADIYSARLPIFKSTDPVIFVKGKLLNAKTKAPIQADIVYERLPEGDELGKVSSDPITGEFELRLPRGMQYLIRADAENYVAESLPLDLRENKEDSIILGNQTLLLVPIEETAVVTLNSVFFDFDKAVLKQESMPELHRIIKLLNERPSMVIEVVGHTDAIGPAVYNLGLSKRRASSVADYLTKKGIPEERMSIKFFGESRPVASNKTINGRKQNRRVEFEIIKK